MVTLLLLSDQYVTKDMPRVKQRIIGAVHVSRFQLDAYFCLKFDIFTILPFQIPSFFVVIIDIEK